MSTKQRTATIERYHVFGTRHYCLSLIYRGRDLTPCFDSLHRVPVMVPDDAEGILRMQRIAKAQGFTHCRFTGDWDRYGRTKPRGGKL
jgi:hypothetical protein